MYYKSEDLEIIGKELGKAIKESKNPNLYLSMIIGIPIIIIIGF